MKAIWNYSNYGNDIRLTRRDAESMSHRGECLPDVLKAMEKPYIKKQLSSLNPASLAKELKEYGVWDEDELKDHNKNLIKWLWISACDVIDRINT